MSINGNPVMIESSGGSSVGNAYGGATSPTSGIGSDGDYYFEMTTKGPGFESPFPKNATSVGGYRFRVGEADITVIGLRVKLRANITGTIKLGTSGGTLMASVSASYNDGDWRVVMLDEPVTLEAGETYAVLFEGSEFSMFYNERQSTHPSITYLTGLTGRFPGEPYSGYAFSADIIIAYSVPYPVKRQYYKSSGAWTEVV